MDEVVDFQHFISNCALFELPSIESKYTWWNERIEEDCIFKKLDKPLINQDFLDALPSSKVSHLVDMGQIMRHS